MEPITRLAIDANALMADHPPNLDHPNKRAVVDVCAPPGTTHRGEIVYTRWPVAKLPERSRPMASLSILEARQDIYDYVPTVLKKRSVEWHVNFADPNLFFGYAGALFAQDELQCAEHPGLGSLREALISMGLPPVTVEGGRPTPVLVAGVERRCRIATESNPSKGRPFGLYGYRFASAEEADVRRATTVIEPPTISNILAIAAPRGGVGEYQKSEILRVLDTAFTGFRAAVHESKAHKLSDSVVVHSGFWGCGAFGGNRIVMPLLQLIAAGMAGVDRLVFHTVDADGTRSLERAVATIKSEFGSAESVPTELLVDEICSLRFQWGVSDGN